MIAKDSSIGRSVPHRDARDKVTGAARYTADIRLENLRCGAVLRSPHHFARILGLDVSEAQAAPGVLAVITAADIPGAKTFGLFVPDQPPLAGSLVRHVGEPIAIVVAGTRDAAQAAADKIRVDYEVLEPVLDPEQALRPGAAPIHPTGNLAAHFQVCEGDVQAGFDQADIVLEQVFSVQRISPGYMEPENSLASWGEGGVMTVWTSSQKPFVDRHEIAETLGLPDESVVVRNAVVGGAFGGKEDSLMAILAALAAWRIRGSVQLVNTRQESFVGHPKRHPARMYYKIGARRDGTLLALQARVFLDTGAYASYGPPVGSQVTELAPGAYRTPNVSVETWVAYTNSPFSGAMRGFGSPQANFAVESMLNLLAGRLGLDPVEVRRKNHLRPGDKMVTRVAAGTWASSLPEIINAAGAAAERLRLLPANPEKLTGVGLSLAIQPMGLGAKVQDDSSHAVEWLPDGNIRLSLGAPDIGQGLATVAEQILAEALELPVEQVQATGLDTRQVPDGGVTCASRMTYLVGNAMLIAAEKLKDGLLDRAADLLHLPKSSLAYRQGRVCTSGGAQIPVVELTSRLAENEQPLKVIATASFEYPEETTPQHLPIGMPHVLFVFGAQVARVEVDPDLGTVRVTDLVAIHDAGKVIHPAAAEGQVEGGVAMGIGYALSEDMALKGNGRWVDSFTEYLLPTAEDMPARMQTILLETPEVTGPYGAKGIGEIVAAPTAPAIVQAVFEATGVRVTSLPVRPEDLIKV